MANGSRAINFAIIDFDANGERVMLVRQFRIAV
jgi:hypothetical protein